MWDGAEQGMYNVDDFSKDGYELHMNTMGWTIADEHYKSWKAAVGGKFKAPQKKYTPGKYSKNKYATENTIALESTAQNAKTIFWKELKTRLKKPEEKKNEEAKSEDNKTK